MAVWLIPELIGILAVGALLVALVHPDKAMDDATAAMRVAGVDLDRR